MKQLRCIVVGLLPPGSMLASIQKYQDRIFRKTGNPSAIGVQAIIPLRSYIRPVDPPKELRLHEPLFFSPPAEYLGSTYLPLVRRNALDSLIEELPAEYSFSGENDMLLYPVFPGIFLCRGSIPPVAGSVLSGDKLLHSASFSAVMVEYRCSDPSDNWWDSIEERIHWELQVRKPAAQPQQKLNRGTE